MNAKQYQDEFLGLCAQIEEKQAEIDRLVSALNHIRNKTLIWRDDPHIKAELINDLNRVAHEALHRHDK